MKYLSVCSGVEAASVAWHDLGWQPVAFSEIEPFPAAVLAHRFPNVPNMGDMTKYKEWNLNEPIELLVGGTPCQSFSVAGLRKGLEDPRGNLMLTYVGILDKFRPKWCVWENVPGVLSSNGGWDFGSFLTALGELRYGFAYRVLDAQNFGVAQRRRRVFVVGCLGGWEHSAKVLFESESLSGNIKKGRKSREEVAGTITARFGNSRNNHEELAPIWPATTASTLNASFGDKLGLENQHINSGAPLFVPAYVESSFGQYREDKIGGTLKASGGALAGGSESLYVSDVSATLTASGAGFSRPGQTSTAHENYIAIQGNLIGRDKGGPQEIGVSDSNVMYTLTKTDVHAIFCDTYNGTIQGNVAATMTADMAGPTHSGPKVMQNMAVRRLTEIECERLQGFPDNYTNIKEKCPSGARYKALGNSMAVPVMRWIGERINQYERI